MRRQRHRQTPRSQPPAEIEELEPRLLFSAEAAVWLAGDAGTTSSESSASATAPTASTQYATLTAAQNSTAAPTSQEAVREIIFVDLGIENADALIADLQAQQAQGRALDIVTIDTHEDGIDVITHTLANATVPYGAVHVLSHGDEEGLTLGSTRLDLTSLQARAQDISAWGMALTSEADLLLYGCNLAAGANGRALVDDLSLLTGADVAASENLTGASLMGGDWVLEYRQGDIDTASALSLDTQQHWQQVLATATFQEGVGGYTGTQDTSISPSAPSTSYGNSTTILLDDDTDIQGLIRFDNLFGTGPGQIPPGSTITAATLYVYVYAGDASETVQLYRMLTSWDESSTWNSMSGGVSTNGVEASSSALASIGNTGSTGFQSLTGLAATVQDWSNGATNYGFLIKGSDAAWGIYTSEYGTAASRPYLQITYTAPTPPALDLDANNNSGGTGSNYNGGFTEGTAAAIADVADATITAGTSATMSGMTVTLNNRPNGSSEVLAANTGGTSITANYDSSTGVLTLSGNGTAAQYQQVLRSITYNNLSDNPDTATRTLTITVTDTYGQIASATSTLTVTAVNDAPTVTTTGSSLGYTENAGAVVVDSGVTVSDVDSANLTGATVRITGNYINGQDVLSFLTQNGITGVWDAGTGTLTLSGAATVAQYQAALRSITYTNSSDNPSTSARTVSFIVTDGALSSTAATRSIAITAVNDAPVVSTSGGSSSFTENGTAVVVDSGVSVSDLDSTNLNGATVRITGNYANGQDLLSFTNQNGISGSWDASTGTLTLSGSATVAQYQTALRSITYSNSSENPSTAARTVSFTVTDSSSAASNTATRTVSVTAVNDAPVITSNGGGTSASISIAENSTAVTTVTATDVDSSNLVYSISGGADAARFTIDSTTGALSFVTAPNFEAPTDAGGNNVYDVIVQVSDGSLTDTQAIAVTVTDVNEHSVGAVSDANAAANQVAENATNGSTVGITANAVDADGSNNTVTYTLSDNAGGRFTINATTGVVTVANGTLLNFEAATSHSITVLATSSDGSTSSQSFTININDVNEFAVGAVSDINAASNTVAENAANGTAVGITARATDADSSNNTVTYTLSNDAGGRFTIDASTGVVTVTNGSLLDFETATSHSITVLATSSDGSTSSQAFTINITDVNESPVGAVSDINAGANQVAENAANGTTVGLTARAVDADGSNNTVTYTLSDNAGGRFAINATTGVVTVANGSLLNYESATSHSITVLATSSDGSTSSESFTINLTDVDEFNVGPVTDVNAATNQVAENAANGMAVGITAQASDADGSNNTITYTLSDNAGGRFTINASTGVVTVADGSLLDFETATSHSITVLATSSDGSTSSQSFTIAVTDANEHAVGTISDVDASTNEVNENASNGDAVGITAQASDADGTNNTVTYTLSDNAGGRFTINATTGAVTVLDASLLDFETDTSHTITVLATSSDGSTNSQAFTINILDGSEAGVGPVSDLDAGANTVAENATAGTTVGITASAIDPDVIDTVSYSLSNNAGGRFTIDAVTGVVTVANGTLLDREAAASHNITVLATSTDGSTTSRTFTINLIDQNESAVGLVNDINAATNQVSEDAADGSLVGITAHATDADATNNTVTYTLSDNAGGRFAINAATGVVTVANGDLLDHEDATAHTITVLATSSDGSTSSQSFTIDILDANEYDVGPVNDIHAAANTVLENAGTGSLVGITAHAVDADGTDNAVTYTLSDDAGGRFAINATTGVVTVLDGSLLDFETASSHEITVVATSADGSTNSQSFTILVGDVSEFPVGAVTDQNASLNHVTENAATGTVVGITAQASDPDGSNNTVTYSLSDNAGGRFTIDATTGVVTVADGSLLDFETATSHTITVLATSSDGSTSSQSFAIGVSDLNEHATGAVSDVDATTNQVAENAATGTLVGITAQATDADGTNNTITYSLHDDAGGRFTIDAVTGVVAVADGSLLDFEDSTSHTIIVQATSSDGSSSSQSFTIGVSDTNEHAVGPVSDVDAPVNQVAENATGGTLVGITASAVDADGSNHTVTYTLSDNAGGRFTIDATTGVVSVANGALLDVEAATSHSITVLATSSDGSTSSQSFTIGVTDVNEHAVGPVADVDGTPNQVTENATNGSTVGITAHAVDLDATNNTVTYSLSDDAGGRFTIDASTGVVRVLDGTLLDREAASSHTITVLATSSDGSTRSQGFTINLLDVNEAPVGPVSDSNAALNTVAENAATGTVVGITAHAVDVDSTTNAVTYTLSDSAGGRFTVDAATGVVTVANGSLLDFETATSHTITVVATSADGSTSSQSFTIGVTDVNEHAVGPVSDVDTTVNQAPENAANGTLVGITAHATDADGTNNTVTYALSDNAGGRFTIDAVTGVVTVANGALLDFESAASHTITVTATSSDGSTSSQSFTIALTDRNDAPAAQLPAGLNATEQTPLALHGTGLSVSDVDAGTGQVRVTLSVTVGTLSAAAGTTGVTVNGSGTSSLQLTGNVAQINALLDGLQGATLNYLINDDAPPSSDTLTLAIDDQGHSGPGGALSASVSTSIAISSVNDAPSMSGPSTWTVGYGQTLPMQGAGNWQLIDVDAGNEIITTTLQVQYGTVTGDAGATAVTISGNGSGNLTVSGTLAQLNAFMSGQQGARLLYVGVFQHLNDTMTVTLNDGQPGGSASALSNITQLMSDTGSVSPDLPDVPSAPAPSPAPSPAPAPAPSPAAITERPASIGSPSSMTPTAEAPIEALPLVVAEPTVDAGLRPALLQMGASFQAPARSDVQTMAGMLMSLGPIEAASLQNALTPILLSISPGDVGIRQAPIPVALSDVPVSDTLMSMVSAENMQLSGTALSVGAVWWVSRSATLLTSLLISTPVWRQLDPLPVFNSADNDDAGDKDGDGDSALPERDAMRRAEDLFARGRSAEASEIN